MINDSGQSTLEFVLSMVMVIAFILFYFQISMIFAFGNFVHYATFMSARAYFSAGPSQENQIERASSVLARMVKRGENTRGLDRFPFIATGVGSATDIKGASIGPGPQYQQGNFAFSWMQGVRYTFRSKVFLIPLVGMSRGPSSGVSYPPGSPQNTISLTSESWLGREPNQDECADELGKEGWLFDNGC